MATELKRLASGTFASTTATVIFTATTRTAIRSIDLVHNSASDDIWFMVDSAGTAGTFWFLGDTLSTETIHTWRGCVVMEPGEKLWIDSNSVDSSAYMVNGVTGLSTS